MVPVPGVQPGLHQLERQNFLLFCQRWIFNVLEQQLNGFLTFQRNLLADSRKSRRQIL